MGAIDFKIDKKTVVHAKTREEAIKLCEFLHYLGARWYNGDRYTKSPYWTIYKENTCYELYNGKYGAKPSFLEDGYDVISVDEFFKLHEPAIQEEPAPEPVEDEKKPDFKIDQNTVVHAKTEDEAIKLCEFLDSLGARWTNGESYVKDNGWSDTKNPCYEIHKGMYDTLQFYESEGGYKIITVDEFLKLHGIEIEPETKAIDFKINQDTVINAKTKDDAHRLYEFLDELGATRLDGGRYTEDTGVWHVYRENTCYDIHEGVYDDVKYYTDDHYDVISVDEFLNLHDTSEQNESDQTTDDTELEIDFKIDDRTFIHAKTEDEANRLCKFLDELGAKRMSGLKYTKNDRWYIFKENTCYNVHDGVFQDIQIYTASRYNKIISVDEFLKLHEPAVQEKEPELLFLEPKEIDFKTIRAFPIHAPTEKDFLKLHGIEPEPEPEQGNDVNIDENIVTEVEIYNNEDIESIISKLRSDLYVIDKKNSVDDKIVLMVVKATNLREFKKTSYYKQWMLTEEGNIYKNAVDIHPALASFLLLGALKHYYNEGWSPDYTNNDPKYSITSFGGVLRVDTSFKQGNYLTFKTQIIARNFLARYGDILESAKQYLR